MKSRRTSTQFAPRIPPKILDFHLTEVNLDERHWPTIVSGFRFGIHSVHEDTHPLISGAMGVNCPANPSGSLDFDTFDTRLYRIAGILALNDQIGMAIKVLIHGQNAGMLCETGRQMSERTPDMIAGRSMSSSR
jgi:hypothetical protein